MARRWIPFLVLFFGVLSAVAPAEAGWVWSPQTGWIGPSGAVKDTPQQQFQYALSFFDQHDYDKARIEFQKLVTHFRNSPEAADGQYYLGRCQEERADYYEAFLAYRKTIQV